MPSKIRLFCSLKADWNDSGHENVWIITQWAQCREDIDASGNMLLFLTHNTAEQNRIRPDALAYFFHGQCRSMFKLNDTDSLYSDAFCRFLGIVHGCPQWIEWKHYSKTVSSNVEDSGKTPVSSKGLLSRSFVRIVLRSVLLVRGVHCSGGFYHRGLILAQNLS